MRKARRIFERMNFKCAIFADAIGISLMCRIRPSDPLYSRQRLFRGVPQDLSKVFWHVSCSSQTTETKGSASGADLVVMATHGRTGVSHLLIGSVAAKVVRESICPVLIVRMKELGGAHAEEIERLAI